MLPPDHRLYLLFTPAACVDDPWTTLAAALRGGVDLVQWRTKTPDDDGFRRCRLICRDHAVPVLVNDDVMLAVRGHAHGAHVGQDDMPVEAARRMLGDRWLGVSTHDAAQITAAARSGADYLGFGPCFPTATKGYSEGLPMAAIVDAVSQSRLPLFAIGGITADNVASLRIAGIDRIAVSSAILHSNDPESAARQLRRML